MPYLDIILVFIMLVICGYTDAKFNKIPRAIALPIAGLGLLNTWLLFDVKAMLWQLLMGILVVLIGFVLFKLKACGGGDVFLVAAMVCTIGWELSLMILTGAMIIGLIYALGYYIIKKPKNKHIMIPLATMSFISFCIVISIELAILL